MPEDFNENKNEMPDEEKEIDFSQGTEGSPEEGYQENEVTEGEGENENQKQAQIALGSQFATPFGQTPNLKAKLPLALKLKIIAIASVAVTILLIILFMVAVIEEKRHSYIAPKCKEITVVYQYKEEDNSEKIPVDEFIISMIHSITKDMEYNFDLINALAITIRTNIQSGTTCKYIVTGKADELFDFQRLDTDSEKYTIIEQDIEITKDLVMAITSDKVLGKPKYISAPYDAFCYDGMGFDDEIGKYYILAQQGLKIPVTWAKDHVNNEQYLNCPCNQDIADDICWDEETNYGPDNQESTTYYYLDGGHGQGLSVYGAYYLAKEENYDHKSILEYFFGDEFEYLTNNENYNTEDSKNNYGTCNGKNIDLTSTPFTRSEFINLVESYLANYTNDHAILLRKNAGYIYDRAKTLEANPEIIFILAKKETQIGNDCSIDCDYYNYYGYDHGNDKAHGRLFNSFEESIDVMLEYTKKYGDVLSMAKSYSYLGYWLWNPGGWSIGGCKYLTLNGYDEFFGSSYERCSSSYYCEPIRNEKGDIIGKKGNCVVTEDYEHEAYLLYQSRLYFQYRLQIFGIEGDPCTSSGSLGIETNVNTDGTKIMTEPLDTVLKANGSSVDKINEYILNSVVDSGIGTREAAVTAGLALINYLVELGEDGYRLPYTYNGGRTQLKNGAGESILRFYGVDKKWGTFINGYYYIDNEGNKYGPYDYYGMDCSAFISWCIRNAGFSISQVYTTIGFKSLGTQKAMGEGREGDVLYKSGHVQFIVENNKEGKYYKTIETTGGNIISMRVNIVPYSTSKYSVIDMTNFYAKTSVIENFEEVYKAGTQK